MLTWINRNAARLVAGVVTILAGMPLADPANGLWLAPFFVALLLAVAIHELGHAFAATVLGMNVHEVSVGPVAYFPESRRLSWNKKVFGYDVGGHVAYDDSKGRYLTRDADRIIMLAGPAANLLTAVMAYTIARFFLPDGAIFRLVLGFAFASLSAFVLSAWPFRLASGRANDALAFIETFDFPKPPPRRPKGSGWQAP